MRLSEMRFIMLFRNRIMNVFFIMVLASFFSYPVLTQADTGGIWTVEAAVPTALQGPAAGTINGKLYVAGGCCISNTPPFPRFNNLNIYDPGSNTWSSGPPIPLAIYGGANGVIDGKLYVAGGQADQNNGNNVANLQVYDFATNVWSNNTPMPFASSGNAAGVIGGKLYVVGGYDPSNTSQVNVLRVYDPITDNWVIGAPMPTARAWVSAGVVNGILYAIGGMNSNNGTLNTVEAYDPTTDTWSTKPLMPNARWGTAVGVINGIIYIAGGYNGTNEVAIVDAYDPVANTWSTQPQMPTARYDAGSGVVNGIFYVVGGGTVPSNFNNANEAFSIAPVLPRTTGQCKNDGWQTFSVFKNQGDCVSFVATKGKNQ